MMSPLFFSTATDSEPDVLAAAGVAGLMRPRAFQWKQPVPSCCNVADRTPRFSIARQAQP